MRLRAKPLTEVAKDPAATAPQQVAALPATAKATDAQMGDVRKNVLGLEDNVRGKMNLQVPGEAAPLEQDAARKKRCGRGLCQSTELIPKN